MRIQIAMLISLSDDTKITGIPAGKQEQYKKYNKTTLSITTLGIYGVRGKISSNLKMCLLYGVSTAARQSYLNTRKVPTNICFSAEWKGDIHMCVFYQYLFKFPTSNIIKLRQPHQRNANTWRPFTDII